MSSLSNDPTPNRIFTSADRMATDMSTLSNDMSFSSLPSGIWDIRFQGSCPKCHHWHHRMKLRLSRLPGVYNGVRCEHCGYKWFGLGGNSTHTSLVSQQTIPLNFTRRLSNQATFGGSRAGAPGVASLVEMNSMSALGSPVLTMAVPQLLQGRTDDLAAEAPQTSPPIASAQVAADQPPLNPLADPASHQDQKQSSEPSATTSNIGVHSRGGYGVSRKRPSSDQEEKLRGTGRASLSSRFRAKVKMVVERLRRRRRPSGTCGHTTYSSGNATSMPSAERLQLPVASVENFSQKQGSQKSHPQEQPITHNRNQQESSFAPYMALPASRRKSAPEQRSDPDSDDTYQKPVPDIDWRAALRDNAFDDQLKELRYQKTIAARQKQCECCQECHHKRLSSSLVPDNPLADQASLYHLDLAVAAPPEPSDTLHRRSMELYGIGGAFTSDIRHSTLSLSSISSMRGRSRSRVRQDMNFVRRNSAAYESQATTAYAPSVDTEPSPRRSSFQRHDMLLSRTATSVPRAPSPLASPSYLPADDESMRPVSPRPSVVVSSIDTDSRRLVDRAPDGFPSVSPIQEATIPDSEPISSVPSQEGHHVNGERRTPSPLTDEEGRPSQSDDVDGAAGGNRMRGPLNSHPLV